MKPKPRAEVLKRAIAPQVKKLQERQAELAASVGILRERLEHEQACLADVQLQLVVLAQIVKEEESLERCMNVQG